ncbi:unnamed protein product, partial [Cyprideis torosa]
ICRSLKLTQFDLSPSEKAGLTSLALKQKDSITRVRTNSIDACHSPTDFERANLVDFLRHRTNSLSGGVPLCRRKSSPTEEFRGEAPVPGFFMGHSGRIRTSDSLSSFEQLSISPPESPLGHTHMVEDSEDGDDEESCTDPLHERAERQDSGYGSHSARRSHPQHGGAVIPSSYNSARSRQSSGGSAVFAPVRERSRTISECSSTSTTLGNDGDRLLFQELIKMKARPSDMHTEKSRNPDEISILG